MQKISDQNRPFGLSLTPYGRPQIIAIVGTAILALIVAGLLWPQAAPWPQVGLLLLMIALLAFFRDPHRVVPDEPNVLLAPADGKVTDIQEVDELEFLRGRALQIGIFLSVLDVHINRLPCRGRVAYIQRHPGKCLNALRWQAASRENEAVSLGLECPDHPAGRVLVKQMTGAIARRIVCAAAVGQELAAGQRYGMIKFGSRTELFIPAGKNIQVSVKKGDKVTGGVTVLARLA